jgi:epoxyqueuosine reductase
MSLKHLIKTKAQELGFFFCGFSKAEFLEDEARQLDQWLKSNYHGKMSYMENHFDKRLDPRKLFDGAKTVISLALNYFPEQELFNENQPKISKYAYGEDYHFVIKDKLKVLLAHIQEEVGDIHGRAFVDSAPVMDKAWAKRSGLGWMGKHTNIITRSHGSFFFIAELIIDFAIEPDGPIPDYCGTCTACIDACPTDAIVQPYVVDGSKCISYLTIELKEAIIDPVFKGQMDNWAFGCDICQDVCPWNRFSKAHNEPRFAPKAALGNLNQKDWQEMTDEVFQELFKRSPIKRTKLEGMKRNVRFLREGSAE